MVSNRIDGLFEEELISLQLPDWDSLVKVAISKYPSSQNVLSFNPILNEKSLLTDDINNALNFLINEESADSISNKIFKLLISKKIEIGIDQKLEIYSWILARKNIDPMINQDIENFVRSQMKTTRDQQILNPTNIWFNQQLKDLKSTSQKLNNGKRIFTIDGGWSPAFIEFEFDENEINTEVINKWPLFRKINTCLSTEL